MGTLVKAVRNFGDLPWTENTRNIRGLDGHVVEDANDWLSDRNGDGRLYPTQLRIYKEADMYHLVDETGWDGHREVPDVFVGTFASYDEASARRYEILFK